MDFQELKAGRADTFERIKDAFDAELYLHRDKSSYRLKKDRLREALLAVGRQDVFKVINDCSHGQRCGSLWCHHCRDQASLASADKLIQRIQTQGYDNSNLLHLTAPVGLASCTLSSVQDLMREEDLRWGRIRRKHSFWIEATYELELVNLQFLLRASGSEMKQQQMIQLVEQCRPTDRLFLFVHWHGVTDVPKDQISHIFGSHYLINGKPLIKTSDSGIYVQGFHEHNDILYNARRLASYPLKGPYRFKHSFKGSDFTNGEYFTPCELGNLVALYHDFQGRQWKRLRRHNHT